MDLTTQVPATRSLSCRLSCIVPPICKKWADVNNDLDVIWKGRTTPWRYLGTLAGGDYRPFHRRLFGLSRQLLPFDFK